MDYNSQSHGKFTDVLNDNSCQFRLNLGYGFAKTKQSIQIISKHLQYRLDSHRGSVGEVIFKKESTTGDLNTIVTRFSKLLPRKQKFLQ